MYITYYDQTLWKKHGGFKNVGEFKESLRELFNFFSEKIGYSMYDVSKTQFLFELQQLTEKLLEQDWKIKEVTISVAPDTVLQPGDKSGEISSAYQAPQLVIKIPVKGGLKMIVVADGIRLGDDKDVHYNVRDCDPEETFLTKGLKTED